MRQTAGVYRQTSPETTTSQKPFQFGLRSIFSATSVVSLALGLLKWLGPTTFVGLVIVAVQSSAVITVLVQSRGTAWLGMVIGGSFAALHVVVLSDLHAPFAMILFFTGYGAWFGGGLGASEETKRRYRFLRCSWLFAAVWFLAVVVIVMIDLHLNPPNW